ncbi:MAG: nucleotidyltransferase domain-containing protein [Acidobacteriaceae bacterium]
MNHAVVQCQADLVSLCRQFHVQRLELFGSALRPAFDPASSDLDFLVEFEPLSTSEYAAAFFEFKEAIEKLFARPVDLVVLSAIRNPWFRESVESSKTLLYAA